MSTLLSQDQNTTDNAVEWEPTPPPTELIFDDGEPLETNRHRQAMNVLIRSIPAALANRTDYFVGGNMFVYYSSQQVRNQDFRGPDFFLVLNIDGTYERQGWVVWEENGRYPNVIIELMSRSTASNDTGKKKDLYEQTFRTPDYFVFNPFDPNSLLGWSLDLQQGYQALEANGKGWLWCESLGLWLGTWDGVIDEVQASWLRFYYDEDGENVVPLPEEIAQQNLQQAEQDLQQAEQNLQQTEQKLQDSIPRLLSMGLTTEQVAEALGLSVEEVNKFN